MLSYSKCFKKRELEEEKDKKGIGKHTHSYQLSGASSAQRQAPSRR